MKKNILLFLPWIFFPFGHKAMAQDDTKIRDKKDKKETEEIIIRKNGNKDATITVQINGDKVLINGKPLVEFKDDGITINKRKMMVRDGDHFMFGDGLDDFGNGNFAWSDDDDENRTFLGVSTEKVEDGAKITEITKESGAEKAGLKKDDIIIMLNDKKIDGPESLSDAVTAMKPKDEVRVTYKRNGKESSIKATLQERKNSSRAARSFSFTSPDGSYKTFSMPAIPKVRSWNNNDDAIIAPEIPEDGYNFNYSFPRRQKLGLKIQDTEEGNGVKVIDVDDSSAAEKAGLKKDDIVTEIGGVKVANTDEAREQLQENREKSAYNIKAKRNGTEMSFEVKIPKKLKTANL